MVSLQSDYAQEGKTELFRECKLYLSGAGPGYGQTSQVLGMTEGAVRVAVHRLRNRYRESLKSKVAATLEDLEAVDDELAYLRRAIRGEKT